MSLVSVEGRTIGKAAQRGWHSWRKGWRVEGMRTKAGADLPGKGTREDYMQCDGKPLEGVKQGLL